MYRNRYEELLDLVRAERPRKILEVGTWNGHRAVTLCSAVNAEYVGFDLFEEANHETDYEEKNVKKHHTVKDVSDFLDQYCVRHTLIKGNTRDTLRSYYGEADFAFIDGGHSVYTIRSDWDNVRRIVSPGGLVVFDDWYEGLTEEDLDSWGANRVVEGMDATFSQCSDPIVGGGFTKLAWVRV